jgi:hypothetical protein
VVFVWQFLTLGRIFNPLYQRFLIFYPKIFLDLMIPVMPTQPLGCPDLQSSTCLSYLGLCTVNLVAPDSPSPKAAAKRKWWDTSPLRKGISRAH